MPLLVPLERTPLKIIENKILFILLVVCVDTCLNVDVTQVTTLINSNNNNNNAAINNNNKNTPVPPSNNILISNTNINLNNNNNNNNNNIQQNNNNNNNNNHNNLNISANNVGHPGPAGVMPVTYETHYPQYLEILKANSYADDDIVTLNLSNSHIYEIDSDAFVGQRFQFIDLSNNKLGLIHSRAFQIGQGHVARPFLDNLYPNNNKTVATNYNGRLIHQRPPPQPIQHITIDFSNNPAIVAMSGAFDHIDVPSVLLNFTNTPMELRFGAFKKFLKQHPGHMIDIESVDCCEQEWMLAYRHNFVARAHCEHDNSLFLQKASQQTIINSCISYLTSTRHTMSGAPGPSVIHQSTVSANHQAQHQHQYWTYIILGGTAMVLTSLSIFIIYFMCSLKAAFVSKVDNHHNTHVAHISANPNTSVSINAMRLANEAENKIRAARYFTLMTPNADED